MIRDFVAGILWGGLVAGAGLGVVSQVAPLGSGAGVTTGSEPDGQEIASADAVTKPAPIEKPVEPVEEPFLAQPKAPMPEGDAPALAPGSDLTLQPQIEPLPKAPDAELQVDVIPLPQAEMPALPKVTEVPAKPMAEAPPEIEAPPAGGLPAETDGPNPDPQGADLLPVPSVTAPRESLLLPEPDQNPAQPPLTVIPDAPIPESAVPGLAVPDAVTTLQPSPGLADKVDGVTTNRLPAIGQETADTAVEPAAETTADLPPIKRFAREFENPAAKPLFAILLIDPGTPDIDRVALAALPFAVTFIIDPLAANARDAAATYRASGQEVVMLASGIPNGAAASDLEQTFQAHAAALPEAVAVIDLASGGFQDNRDLAAQVLLVLKAQGRGLITFDQGLNAADQVARREDVAAAVVFRTLDDDGEDAPVIRRYLDRAAFKAAQEGRVAVVGTARPETIAALLEWAVEGRAASVMLAPITAVMSVE